MLCGAVAPCYKQGGGVDNKMPNYPQQSLRPSTITKHVLKFYAQRLASFNVFLHCNLLGSPKIVKTMMNFIIYFTYIFQAIAFMLGYSLQIALEYSGENLPRAVDTLNKDLYLLDSS